MQLSWHHMLLVDCVLWTIAGIGGGYLMHRLPLKHLRRDGPLTRLRAFEQGGRLYGGPLRIQRWKPYLPEASALFGPGFSKHRVRARDRAYFERFAAETRRAELTHWMQLAIAPALWAFNPWSLALIMSAYALLANLPFILVQRYNRARLLRILARPQTRASAAARASLARAA